MAEGHREAVDHMLSYALQEQPESWTAIDAGCGNGWVVRRLRAMQACRGAVGIDGAAEMIDKARRVDPAGDYVHAELMDWAPRTPVDLVHSMEVLYYFKDPGAVLAHMAHRWLKPGGRLIVGIDHYQDNPPSLNWAAENGIAFMTTLSEQQWVQLLVDAGLVDVRSWRFNAKDPWAGTLVLTGHTPTQS